MQTIHSSAQFTLTETKSGLYLVELFPELKGKVIPLLRETNRKYKKLATDKIFAYSSIEPEAIENLKVFLKKRKRKFFY